MTAALAWPAAADAIIGGRAAEPGTYPWLAHVTDSLRSVDVDCTGTVIAPRLVLTAAHCVIDDETAAVGDPAGFTVVTGSVDWQARGRQAHRVDQVVIAPGYEVSTGIDDAALLVLARPTSAPALALARRGYDASVLQGGTRAWIAGWGDRSYAQPGLTEDLQEAETALPEPAWCARNAPTFYAAAELCVIDSPSDRTGTCDGDSGGPLIVGEYGEEQPEEEWVDLGVLSGNFGDCATTEPSIYTRVDALYPWIRRWMKRAQGQ